MTRKLLCMLLCLCIALSIPTAAFAQEPGVYRVVGNTDWMGLWDPANDLGIMTETSPGHYEKTFEDVPPGNYELRITKDGKWDYNASVFSFTVIQRSDVTVDLTVKNGEYVFFYVSGPGLLRPDGDEDTEILEKGSDWGITLYAVNATPAGMTLLTNQMGGNYNSELEYDDTCYTIEMLQDGVWIKVPPLVELVCPLEADSVMPNACYRENLNWEREYGALAPGHYRLVREFFDSSERVNLYAQFIITEAHACVSEDQDLLCDRCLCLVEHPCEDKIGDAACDICGKRISDEDVYRVVGNADWMGDNRPRSNQGIMAESKSGVYRTTVQNVSPGDYSFIITKNGNMGLLGEWSDRYEFTVSQTTDLTFTLDLRDGLGQVSVNGPGPLAVKEPVNQKEFPKTEDTPVYLPATLLLVCAAAVPLLLSKRKKIQ